MNEAQSPLDRRNVGALIPAYLEERHIREVARRAREQLDTVLVVDDGSTDSTAAEARKAGVEVLLHTRNQGKGAAIKTGLRELSPRPGIQYILILDGDGQHLPEEIPRFLAEANHSHSALIMGNRMSESRKMPLVRRLTNQFMSAQVSRVCGQSIPDTQCGFRMIRRDLVPTICGCQSSNYEFESEMLVIASRLGHRIGSVPVSTVYGGEKSKIRPVSDTIRFIRLMSRLKASNPGPAV